MPLGIIHQLMLHGVLSSLHAHELDAAMINWLLEHHDDVVGFHGAGGRHRTVCAGRRAERVRDRLTLRCF